MVDLRNTIIKKEISENKNPNKIVDNGPSDLATCIEILTSRQMLQRLPIVLTQVKAVNTSENLLNEVCQIIYSLYQEKKIAKEVYKNIMNSINL